MAAISLIRRLGTVRAGTAFALLVACLAGQFATDASASHFRSGNLSWQKTHAGTEVTFQNTQAWRRTAFPGGSGSDGYPVAGDVIDNGEGCINPGDGQNSVCPRYRVTFANVAEDYLIMRAVAPDDSSNPNVRFVYSGNGPFTASTSSCCTIDNLNNAPSASWNVRSLVDLTLDEQSPRSSIPPIVNLPSGGVQRFRVPATDARGDALHFRLSNAGESCAGCPAPQPPGLAIDSSTGQVTWDTTERDGLWWAGVVIEARNGTTVLSTTQIQFIIRVGGGGSNNPPEWTSPPTPDDGATFNVVPGQTLSFDLEAADPDVTDEVQIFQNEGPGTTTTTDGNPARATYTFTASESDLGTERIVQFLAQDSGSPPLGPPFRSYTIRVVSPEQLPEPLPPEPPPPPPTPDPPPGEPEPVLGETGNFERKSGEVFVKLPEEALSKPEYAWARRLGIRGAGAGPRGFVPLTSLRQLPVGSTIDTRRGTVGLTVATNAEGTGTQEGDFSRGTFVWDQSHKTALTTLSMAGNLRCGTKAPDGGAAKVVSAARRSRRLFGSGRGRFRTRGRNSSATVRGTQWLQKDTCRYTVTKVYEGSVQVRDLAKERTVTLRQGGRHRYVARRVVRRRVTPVFTGRAK